MADTIQVKGDIDLELWEIFRNKFSVLDDEAILKKVLELHSNIIDLKSEEGDLLSELDEQKKLAESLRKKCKNFALRVKNLEDTQADQDGEIEKLKKQNRKLSKGIPDFGDEAKIKEKIVYREDTKTINELKEKRDSLQKSLWEKNAEIEKLEKSLSDLQQNLDIYEEEKGKIFGFLVKLVLDDNTSKYKFSFETISRGEFNKLMRSKEEFCKYKKIFTPASVIKLWEKETDDLEVIDLEETIRNMRTKSNVKLTEISMPYAEYETLKQIEKQFPAMKEKFEHISTEFKNVEIQNKELIDGSEKLKLELQKLKDNPIVKEKIVYKENTKELEELRAECERLRLKMFNYETGRINVPTHGISVGNVYRVVVEGVGKDGDGFTKVNNFIIFVPNTKKDQEVNIKVTRVLKKYAFGKVVDEEPTQLNTTNQIEDSDSTPDLGVVNSDANTDTNTTVEPGSQPSMENK